MADFCKQCSFDNFKIDFKDFPIKFRAENRIVDRAYVLCHSCGPTIVDAQGTCVCTGCMKGHGIEDEEIEEGATLHSDTEGRG